MASIKDEAELLALKHAISEFFARRADEEMEKLWQSGEWNEQTLQDLKNSTLSNFLSAMSRNIVLDTNCLVQIISAHSPYRPAWQAFS